MKVFNTVQLQHSTINLLIKAYYRLINTALVQILNMDSGSPVDLWPSTQHRKPGPILPEVPAVPNIPKIK